jgi:BON domain
MHQQANPGRTVIRLAGAGVCVVALFATAVAAAAPPAANSRDTIRDLQLTVHARKALHDDESLSSLNPGVRVRDGVATIWGTAPSAELIARAKKCVESVQGILSVRSELQVARPDRSAEPLVIPLLPPEPLLSESASPDSLSGSIAPQAPGVREPVSAAPPAEPTAGVEYARPLSPPVDHATTVRPSQAHPVSRSTAPASEPLQPAVERLRGSDPRFRSLRVEARGTTVVIAAAPERDEEVMALARAISRLPGVERVVTKTDDGRTR